MATLVPTGPGTRHERESLSNRLSMIDPLDTPIYSGCSKVSATAIKIEWTVQELTGAADDTFQVYGADSTDADGLVPVRFSNVVGESPKDGKVADIYDNINTVTGGDAGAATELARQKYLKGYELRRDVEAMLSANQAADTTTTPIVGGLGSWLTNVDLGATGVACTGDGTDTTTVGNARPLDTIAYIQDALTAARKDGGKPSRMYMTPDLKPSFSQIPDAAVAGTATINEINSTPNTAITQVGAVSNWLSDFGNQQVIVSDHMLAGTIYGLDPNYVSIAIVPNGDFVVNDLGKPGASDRFQIVHQWSLRPDAPKAHYGVFSLTAA